MFDIYMKGVLSYEDDLSFLRLFENFGKDKKSFDFSYNTVDPIYRNILSIIPEKYSCQNNGDFKTQVNLMVWTHNLLTKANVQQNPPHKINFFSILECINTQAESVNCLCFATFLTEIFLALGYKSRIIKCLPIDLRGTECHCMTEVYSTMENKWIVFDPAFCTYYTDIENRVLGTKDIRYHLVNCLPINTPFVPQKRKKELIKYLTKNMVRFRCYLENEYNTVTSEKNKTIIHLNPKSFEISDKIIDNGEYTVQIINTTNDKEFWKAP